MINNFIALIANLCGIRHSGMILCLGVLRYEKFERPAE